MVGVQGNYYVAVGDSITNGVGDNYSSDNTSLDGRIISVQGYQAKLDDLLTSTLSFPDIVFNEGIAGDSSANALNLRIGSILERHPESNKVLVMLGTIDSGQAVLPGPGPGTYQANMQALIQTAAGKEVWVALVPPVFNSDGTLNTTRDDLIVDYNAVINNSLGGCRVGPDFYSFFLNRFSLLADGLHPNGYGTALMAYLWHNALDPTHAVPLPLILENISPTNYKQNLLEVNDTCYVDQSFTLASIPSALQNGVWIMTADADRNNSSQSFLSFDVGSSLTTIFVAYQSGKTPPSWLTNNFQKTSPLLQISVNTGGAVTRFDLYRKDNVTGPILPPSGLGGNNAPGASGADYNYLVIGVRN